MLIASRCSGVPSTTAEEACLISDDGDLIAVAMEEILAYLRAHPSAADTVDGIARWWLGAGAKSAATEDVQEALNRLAETGLIDVRHLPDGVLIYGLSAAARGPDGARTDPTRSRARPSIPRTSSFPTP